MLAKLRGSRWLIPSENHESNVARIPWTLRHNSVPHHCATFSDVDDLSDWNDWWLCSVRCPSAPPSPSGLVETSNWTQCPWRTHGKQWRCEPTRAA